MGTTSVKAIMGQECSTWYMETCCLFLLQTYSEYCMRNKRLALRSLRCAFFTIRPLARSRLSARMQNVCTGVHSSYTNDTKSKQNDMEEKDSTSTYKVGSYQVSLRVASWTNNPSVITEVMQDENNEKVWRSFPKLGTIGFFIRRAQRTYQPKQKMYIQCSL